MTRALGLTVTVRNARLEDAASLAALASSVGQAQDAVTFSQHISSYSEGFFIAEENDTISGYLVLRLEPNPSCVQGRSPIQLWRLFVSPVYQGKGVARSLISHAIAHARTKRHDVVWLGTAEDNTRAIAFYSKSGFRSVGVTLLGQGHSSHLDLIMSRAIQ